MSVDPEAELEEWLAALRQEEEATPLPDTSPVITPGGRHRAPPSPSRLTAMLKRLFSTEQRRSVNG